jgi:hypothetical protein
VPLVIQIASRLAVLSSPAPTVVAGSWHRGVQGYDAMSRRIVWWRKDLKHVQQVCDLSNRESHFVGIGLDERHYHIVDARNGETAIELYGMRKIHPHPDQDLCLFASKEAVHLSKLGMPPIWKAPLHSFAVLDASFSREAVAYSESGGHVHCLDYYGECMWVFVPERDRHVLKLAWEPHTQRWLGVDWNYENGGAKRLLEIDSNGRAVVLMEIGKCAHQAFFGSGRFLITSEREVISTATCKTVWEFRDVQ